MKRAGRITEEMKDRIRVMTKDGRTQNEIAEVLGISQRGVSYQQRKLGLKASNKWHFGESPEIHSEETHMTPVIIPEIPFVKVGTKIQMEGIKSRYVYEINFADRQVTVRSGYSEEWKIDLSDLLWLGNELIDISEKAEKIRAVLGV